MRTHGSTGRCWGNAMRICLIASSRYPLCEPFAGGLESWTHQFARELVAHGHSVSVFAAPGSDPTLPVTELQIPMFVPSTAARDDVGAPPASWMAEHHAYLGLMLDLARSGRRRFDVVHNNSLHHLPVAMEPALKVPLVTTLHTPPLPWLESAIALSSGRSRFVAVSRATARSWEHVLSCEPILNGVDTRRWAAGPGGCAAVWSGRLVPEKAPHEAIDAARLAGMSLVLAGPIPDRRYFAREVVPRLGADVSYVGHLKHRDLAGLLGAASVAVVTPAWEEPYGLVAAEAMACGTPVAAYARGALPEIVSTQTGALAEPGNVADLADAIRAAHRCPRDAVRATAERDHSLERMVHDYERCYEVSLGERVA